MRMSSNVAPTFCMQVPLMLSIYKVLDSLKKKERSGLNKKNNNSLLSDEIF